MALPSFHPGRCRLGECPLNLLPQYNALRRGGPTSCRALPPYGAGLPRASCSCSPAPAPQERIPEAPRAMIYRADARPATKDRGPWGCNQPPATRREHPEEITMQETCAIGAKEVNTIALPGLHPLEAAINSAPFLTLSASSQEDSTIPRYLKRPGGGR